MTTPASTSQSPLTDQAAESADAVIRSVRQKAHDALDGLSSTVQTVRDQASAAVEKIRPQLDSVAAYAKDEPTKALLIAAAAGAGLMALVALMSRSRGTRLPTSKTLRMAANDAIDDIRQAARDAADRASAQAESTMKSARGSAESAYQSAYDGVSDKVQQWKDQAAPLVDRIRPQIDTVMTYAKDDPAKALLIAAGAGAALMALVSSIGR